MEPLRRRATLEPFDPGATSDSGWERALRAMAERRYDAAAVLWDEYSRSHPEMSAPVANRVLCLLNSGQPEEALSEARRAYGLEPSEGTHWVLLEALDQNGLHEELGREAEVHTKEYPQDPHGWSRLGTAAVVRQEYEEAERCFRRTVELRNDANFAWANLAQIYLEQHRYEDAFDAWSKALGCVYDRPGPPELPRFQALMGMGWSLLYLGLPERGLILAKQAEGYNVNASEVSGLKARCLFATDHPSAVQAAEDAFRLGYESHYLRARLAYEYAALRRREKAEEHLQRAKPDPDHAETRGLMAGTLTWLGRTDEAIRELEDLDGILEPYIRLNSLAAAYRIAGNEQRAEEMSPRALELNRDEVILTNLATQYNEQGRFVEAKLLSKEALELKRGFSEALYQLGYACVADGNEGEGRGYLKQALRSEYARETIKVQIAELLGRLDEGREIEAAYKRQGAVPVSYTELQRVLKRSERQDTLRYEDECGRLAAERKGKLRWAAVETRKMIRHAGKVREADVYGLRKKTSGENAVVIGECKLKTSSTVSRSEMNELVGKMALALCAERHGERRKVEGVFFSNVPYDAEAEELAEKHVIRTLLARPQKNWRKKANWRLRPLDEA